ncbi:MAG: hypothetical protein A3C90_02820 [Candidatus Magasanikbacteria bacterium RIFCSPHIGHO2_02_FULL_51_14]|uniref:SHS2 domain-containing protein n=1 Tax=Candidatus Magasanikbacteria bacterium RIFCSPHIGHO2_02_FULL_51_14 TaxID=1798683 RepID=A0A1F6MF78_9BACT|nr:MAG: hypothetical protein A3C90_02820 [Candidatus Magasanikbacteria bacterium RIFCSPHIGHO2_02_FULL_51_14]
MFSLSKSAVGLDISDHTIEVVEIQKFGGGVTIVSKNRGALEPGIVLHGRIQDVEKLKSVVAELLKNAKPKPITNRRVIFGLPEVQVYTHAFRMRELKPSDIEQALPQAVASAIPLPEGDAIFSHAIVEHTKEYADVLVVAGSRKVVEEWSDFLRSLGFDIEALDIEPLAILRDLSRGKPSGVVCVADMGSRTTNLSFFDKAGLRYTQTSHIAGNTFTESMVPHFKNDATAAEQAKIRDGLKQKNAKAGASLLGAVSSLLDEIQKAVVFFEQLREEKVEELVFVGGSSQMKGLLPVLKKIFSIPARLGASLLADSAGIEYLGAIGMALRGVNQKWMKNDPVIPLDVGGEKESRERQKKSQKTERVIEAEPAGEEQEDVAEASRMGESEPPKDRKRAVEAIVLASILLAGALLLGWTLWYRAERRAGVNEAREATLQSAEDVLSEIDVMLEQLQAPEVVPEPTVTSSEEISEASVMQGAATSSASFVRVVSSAVAAVNLREAPSTAASLLMKVSVGTEHELLGKNQAGDWWQIKVVIEGKETVGWMSAVYLVEVGAVDNSGR